MQGMVLSKWLRGSRAFSQSRESLPLLERNVREPAFLKWLKSDLVKKGDEDTTDGDGDEGDATTGKKPSLIGRPSFLPSFLSSFSLSHPPSVCRSAASAAAPKR